MPREWLYGKLANFRTDVDKLRTYYEESVKDAPATQYFDNNAAYEGWAITSRDGSTADGVKQIGKTPDKSVPNVRGVQPTELCTGYVQDVLEDLRSAGVKPYRVRVMRLASEGMEMKFHRDAEKETWRLHIPILTNPACFFVWELGGGRLEQVHMPADGSAYLVRVDVTHRAVNHSPSATTRVHLLMGLTNPPEASLIAEGKPMPAEV